MRRSFAIAAIAAASVCILTTSTFGTARAESYRVTGPVVHENLAIYFVHGASAAGAVPLSLQEAMAKGAVKVHETGRVDELAVENLGGDEVFIQSGDIVKGGRQDRVLMVSLLLGPRTGVVPIASFCVEQGRWTARGREDSRTFSASESAVPSKEARLALRAPMLASAGAPETVARQDRSANRQGRVWDSVARTQQKLSDRLSQPVAAPASATSLQLSLENEKLKDAQRAYLTALQGAGEEGDDVIGYVFAINGKIAGADIYPSNGLFRKMWPKLLGTNATEAIAEKGGAGEAVPSAEAVQTFLDGAQSGTVVERALNGGVHLATRENERLVYSETSRGAGGWFHRNYVGK